MNVTPIKKINYSIFVYASAFQKLEEIMDYDSDSVIVIAFATFFKKEIMISDFAVAPQTRYYSNLKLDEAEYLAEYQEAENQKDEKSTIVPIIIYKSGKDGTYCNIGDLKDFFKKSFDLFAIANYKQNFATEFTIYDHPNNLKYEEVPMYIDTFEFEYGYQYIKEHFEERYHIAYQSSSWFSRGCNSTYYSAKSSRPTRPEVKDAAINSHNPKISDITSIKANEINMKGFQYILQCNQSNLLAYLPKALEEFYTSDNIVTTYDYIYCKGEYPILLVCHLDTKHLNLPDPIFVDKEQDSIWSPNGIGGDDRCGVYAALSVCNILGAGKKMPFILFTTDEEVGCYGAKQAAIDLEKDKAIFRYLLEMDRHGKDEVVYYNTNNKEFEKYVQAFGFVKREGLSSDIVHLTSKWGVASCNISIGYYNEHTFQEFIKMNELLESIGKVVRMVACSEQAPCYSQK